MQTAVEFGLSFCPVRFSEKAVLDTNVLIDALVGGELPALDRALRRRIPIVPIRPRESFSPEMT